MVTNGKVSIITLIIYFVVYLGMHYFIGLKKNKLEEDYLGKPGNGKLEKDYNRWCKIFKWFPAIYLIVVVLLMVL